MYNLPSFLGVVPDTLANLKHMINFAIFNTPITKMTEQLGFLTNLHYLYLHNCNLTNLPDLSGIPFLPDIDFSYNQLSQVNGLNNVSRMTLAFNLFTDVPVIKNSKSLYWLQMTNNPVKNMLTITTYTNLQCLYLQNTNISSVPHNIDKLQKLEYFYLNNNKLSSLPTNILNLPNLQIFNIQNNLFPSSDIQIFQSRFNQTNPNITLYV